MLSEIRTLLLMHLVAAKSSLRSLVHEPIASLMTVLSIACILMLPAIFLILSDNIKHWTTHLKHNETISIYLQQTASMQDANKVLVQVQSLSGVQQATLKTPEEGLKELSQQEGMQAVIADLTDNPLPAVIEIVPFEFENAAAQQAFYHSLQSLTSVEQVKVDAQWADYFDAILQFLKVITHMLMIFLATAIVCIIANTLRQAVANRYEEIQILKLVGAKDSYIIRPFLYRGIWYGVSGAVVACVLVQLFSVKLTSAGQQLLDMFSIKYDVIGLSFSQNMLFCVISMGLGWVGAWLAAKRQLVAIEPYE